MSKMNIQCLSNSGSANNKVVTLHWYSGKHGLVHRDAPTLAICYDNGRMQIMRDENDESKYSWDILGTCANAIGRPLVSIK